MSVSTSSTYDETYEYNRFCQIIDPIIAKEHSGQKLIVVLDNIFIIFLCIMLFLCYFLYTSNI